MQSTSRAALGRAALLALVTVHVAGCFPTPTPQHAVWRPGREISIQVAPLPAVAPRIDEQGDVEGTGLSWPGLIGGRFGYATSRVRANIGAFMGLAVYGDASLAVRLASLGRVHTAIAVEGGVGAAALTAAAILGDLVGEDETSGALTWGRVRPLITFGPARADASGNGVTLGGLYGSFAGVRELGGSLGFVFGSAETGSTRTGGDGLDWEKTVAENWETGSVDLYVLWHRDLSHPSVLLTVTFAFGQRTISFERKRGRRP